MLKVVGASWFQTRMSTCILGTVGALGVLAIILGEMSYKKTDGVYSATVYWSETAGFNINFWGQGNVLDKIPEGAGRAYYKQEITTNGWAVLEIQTNPQYPDWVQAFAAGFLEGSLTWQLIHWHWLNTVRDACNGRQQFCDHVYLLLKQNSVFMEARAEQFGDKDPFWHQVRLFYMQLHGIETGWQRGVERARQEIEISHIDFLWMNMVSDLPDLEKKFNSTSFESSFAYSAAASFTSAFVKFQPESKELFVAHNTGGLYQSMLRVLKCYQFGYHYTSASESKLVPGQVIAFTSYPGVIHSQDDFYFVAGKSYEGKKPHQFAITGTSFAYYNKTLWSKIKPSEKVWIGPRVMAANRLARNGSLWGKTLARYASDTGNKQWLFVEFSSVLARQKTIKHDAQHNEVLKNSRLLFVVSEQADKNFVPLVKHKDKKSLLWVVEQLPGRTHVIEQSHTLRRNGYWFSNGVPHHMGATSAAPNVPIVQLVESEDIDSNTVLQIMRKETFLASLSSYTKPVRIVKEHASRQYKSLVPMGIIDTKVISSSFHHSLDMQLLAGPLQSCTVLDNKNNTNIPQCSPFRWSTSPFANLTHEGHPDEWSFNAFHHKWIWCEQS